MSKFRKKLSQRTAKKQFSRGARKTHVKNVAPRPMRGGIRL